MVVVMNFEHHLDGATNITVLTDHQTLKGCLTPNLNEHQTHRLISFYPTTFTFHWKGALMIHSILGDQTIQQGHKVDAWKAWYTTSSEHWNEFFVLVWKAKGFLSSPALPLRGPMTKNVWTTSPEENLKSTCGRRLATIRYCLKGSCYHDSEPKLPYHLETTLLKLHPCRGKTAAFAMRTYGCIYMETMRTLRTRRVWVEFSLFAMRITY